MSGLMSEADKRIVLEHMERIYRELFAQYDEFVEVDVMLKDKILTYSEEAAEKAKLEGIREGKAEGKAEGIEEGIEKGKVKKAFEMVRKLLARGMALTDIAEIADLPIDKLQTLVPHS
jgi:flagellar biosynthesis/type III secretory pathway protein FliH